MPGSTRPSAPEATVGMPGAEDAVAVGARVLVVVYGALVVAHLVLLTGTVAWVMAASAAATAALGAWVLWAPGPRSVRRTQRDLLVICLVPLATSLLHLSLTGQLEQTTLLMLVVLAIGAVSVRRAQAVALTALACLAWIVVVIAVRPQPTGQVGHYAIQLGLAAALAAAVFLIREKIHARLAAAERQVASHVDSLERARAETQVTLHKLQALFDASPVGLTLSDEHGRLVEVNDAFCRFVGRTRDELLGRSAAGFTHPDDLYIVESSGALISHSDDGVARLEKRYLLPDKSVRWAWLSLAHVAGPDQETWTLAHVQDVTERKAAEEEVRRSRQVIEAARDIARATQLGQDPRPITLERLIRLADASSAQFIEPGEPGTLVVTACAGAPDLTGLAIDLSEQSATGHVWSTGETVFASDVHEHPLVNRTLLRTSTAKSLMWLPVGAQGDVRAVLSIAWGQGRSEVSALQRTAVETLVAEAGVALIGERMRNELEHFSTTDPLTGLLNRRGWTARARSLVRRARAEQVPITLALLDLDHFKAYNDTFGHPAGDTALSEFAAGLRACARSQDVAARWGGEEFLVALYGCDPETSTTVLERLRECAPQGLTCSAGATRLEDGESVETAIARADTALYAAKRLGRDQLQLVP